MSITASAALLACAAVPGAVSAAQGRMLPQHAAPRGLRSADVANGGRVMVGSLRGVNSTQDAFVAGLRRLRGYFDGRPHMLGAVRSANGAITIGAFDATLRGAPVRGIAITAFEPRGGSRVGILFDYSDRIARSINPLFERVRGMMVPSSAPAVSAAAVKPLHAIEASDGTVDARIPAGWRPILLRDGAFAATGPDGSEVDQEVSLNFADPRSSLAGTPGWPALPYTAEPAQALSAATRYVVQRGGPDSHLHIERETRVSVPPGMGTAAELIGTETLRGGRPGRFDGVALVSPLGQYGGWSLSVKMISAPAETFQRELPTLLAIFESYHVNQERRGEQVHENIAAGWRQTQAILQANAEVQQRNSAVFNASMANARNVQDSIDRSTAGFVHYLNDTTVLQHVPNGETGTVNQNFATGLIRADPRNFREVPVSEYQKGIHY
ncbi:MAG: hypothetical protein GIX03_05850 [Candidatus Eremiobacteraeota bacterium]|nr:hypothetical protein [Candidatus Eremiobacteraeota bacterium]MBC5802520.1 hypothetical protein [Candidatus Eremiobacteraeota bacterium]MBC5820527.1 hypothetical protein [Candidatus Eremiobacteraeota bacterium]